MNWWSNRPEEEIGKNGGIYTLNEEGKSHITYGNLSGVGDTPPSFELSSKANSPHSYV